MESSTAYANNLGAGSARIAPISPPSLEDRLTHLEHGCERLLKLRNAVAAISNRISPEGPETGNCSTPRPNPTALTERYGDAIAFVHASCDDLERTITRLENQLFSCNQKQLEAVRR